MITLNRNAIRDAIAKGFAFKDAQCEGYAKFVIEASSLNVDSFMIEVTIVDLDTRRVIDYHIDYHDSLETLLVNAQSFIDGVEDF